MNDMKVGILTFHNSRNYGALLQAYALQKKIKETVNNVEIMDYYNEKIEEQLKLWNLKEISLKNLFNAVLSFIFRFRKKISFDNFINNYLEISTKIDKSNISDYSHKYNLIIVGSDQVWNLQLTNNDENYFLNFKIEGQRRISYAASFGDEIVSEKRVYDLLSCFDLITIRETYMLENLKRNLNKEINVCCDPTLLISSNEWKLLANKKRCKSKYLFLFLIKDSIKLKQYARKICKDKNLILICNKNCFKFFLNTSPKDFLSWILNAEYVLTNSFHCTIFSLHFEKKFACDQYTNDGKIKLRIKNLLEKMSLTHRELGNGNFNIEKIENWSLIKNNIEVEALNSWDIITEWFNNVYRGDKQGEQNQSITIS